MVGYKHMYSISAACKGCVRPWEADPSSLCLVGPVNIVAIQFSDSYKLYMSIKLPSAPMTLLLPHPGFCSSRFAYCQAGHYRGSWALRSLACKPHTSISTEHLMERPGVAMVVLKKGKAQLFRDGHPMVYSGAVDSVVGRPPPKSGDAVVVTDGAKHPIAWGFYNPVSMFCVRIMQLADEVSRDRSCLLDVERLVHARISAAVQLRKVLELPGAHTSVYRLVNSEGDRLSGLIVDMLDGHAVVSSSAAWVEKHRSVIEMTIRSLTSSTSLTWRPSVEILRDEGVEVDKSEIREAADTVKVLENGLLFKVVPGGQKTGFYADQRDSRFLFRSLCKGRTVLDLCCYTGAFSLNAAVGGATHVTGVDSSRPALGLAQENAGLNDVDTSSICFVKADIAEYMKAVFREGRRWDVIVLDPPKLAPSRKVLDKAKSRYRTLNALAMRLTRPGGLLMTCSCSGAMTQSGLFMPMLQEAAFSVGRKITVLRYAGAGADHPQDPCYPEGSYLTNVLLCVS